MAKTKLARLVGRPTDVVICGGGLAGLTLARQLRRELPELDVVVLERTSRPLPAACHKVGESSVELASHYFSRLGLGGYLNARHIVKFGLRFFPGGGDLPLAQRCELGPDTEPVVPSYQLDRGVLEEDLRAMIEEDGATLIEGAKVSEVEVGRGADLHTLQVQHDGVTSTLQARWLVDATGRNALLRRTLKLARGARHRAHSGWFRVKGRLDISAMAPPEDHGWGDRPAASERWRSTNHLMGDGYWVWLIPLSSGHTSVGVVVHEPEHIFDDVRTLEAVRAFIRRREPALHAHLTDATVLDFRCLKAYSNGVARAWSVDRWALVGEAGAFTDPLYSPGSDLIAFANCFTVEVIKADIEGGDLASRVGELNRQYRAFVLGGLDVFVGTAPVYGHARAMATKIYWDNFAYWNFPCQYFFQRIYALRGDDHAAFSGVGIRFVEISGYVQKLLREWARMAPEGPTAGFVSMPSFPSLLVDAHLALQDKMSPAQTLEYMKSRAVQGQEILAELLLRIVQELGPSQGKELLARAGAADWGLEFGVERLDQEVL
ncbi:MAG: NAD(P)/FAD-dependent oxidoreductase, partial [Nannocystaceae bacterium]